jgi:hypothetical protein
MDAAIRWLLFLAALRNSAFCRDMVGERLRVIQGDAQKSSSRAPKLARQRPGVQRATRIGELFRGSKWDLLRGRARRKVAPRRERLADEERVP